MNETLLNISLKHRITINKITPLQGGDINQVFLLNCKEGDFVIKVNNASNFPNMFEVESRGLELLRNSDSFKIPKVHFIGIEDNNSYLLLQYLKEESKKTQSWNLFSQKLARLHKTKSDFFGLDHHNYIGSLPQFNNKESKASEFYINQRLIPQFKIASKNGFHFSKLNNFYKNISNEIPNETPSLIHGDLWNGNYLVSDKQEPALIDPAVAFAPREMDFAMMKLFGGFSKDVFNNYNEIFPLECDWEGRILLWQLYYLLVHLNLFGSGYLSQVKDIIIKYS